MQDVYESSPFYVQNEDVALRMSSELTVSAGSADLTPFAVRWRLAFKVFTNRQPAHFELVENMLRSMLKGLKSEALKGSLESYKQTRDGFILVFAPGLVDPEAARTRRRYVKTLEVRLEYIHAPRSLEVLFNSILELGDYALTGLLQSLVQLAPAVFSSAYSQVQALTPLFRPLQLGLNLQNHEILEVAVERNLQANALNEIPRKYSRMFFNNGPYVPHEFVVLVDDGQPCTHELVCWDQL